MLIIVNDLLRIIDWIPVYANSCATHLSVSEVFYIGAVKDIIIDILG